MWKFGLRDANADERGERSLLQFLFRVPRQRFAARRAPPASAELRKLPLELVGFLNEDGALIEPRRLQLGLDLAINIRELFGRIRV